MDLRTWREEQFKVAGEVVTMEIRPLFNEDMVTLAPHIERAGEECHTPEEKKRHANEALPAFAGVFRKTVRNVQGLTVDGAPIEDSGYLAEDMRLQELAWDIVVKLIRLSKLDEEDVKNSGGESPEPVTVEQG